MDKVFTIRYRFLISENREERFSIDIDEKTLELVRRPLTEIPFWAKIDYHQCPNCTLKPEQSSYCPLCLSIAPIVGRFETMLSYDVVSIEVETKERRMVQKTTVQRALCSLMGLVMAVSGCTHTAYFKPMARFHLPLSTEEETVYRASSMYLLAQFYIRESGGTADAGMEGLKGIYMNLQQVNMAIAKRLRAATSTDSTVNAVIMLDMFAKSMPYNIDDSMEVMRYLFQGYLKKGKG
jgi:hypothetical protein